MPNHRCNRQFLTMLPDSVPVLSCSTVSETSDYNTVSGHATAVADTVYALRPQAPEQHIGVARFCLGGALFPKKVDDLF